MDDLDDFLWFIATDDLVPLVLHPWADGLRQMILGLCPISFWKSNSGMELYQQRVDMLDFISSIRERERD